MSKDLAEAAIGLMLLFAVAILGAAVGRVTAPTETIVLDGKNDVVCASTERYSVWKPKSGEACGGHAVEICTRDDQMNCWHGVEKAVDAMKTTNGEFPATTTDADKEDGYLKGKAK